MRSSIICLFQPISAYPLAAGRMNGFLIGWSVLSHSKRAIKIEVIREELLALDKRYSVENL